MRDKNTNINFNSSQIISKPQKRLLTISCTPFFSPSPLASSPGHFFLKSLIPRPLLPEEKGSNAQLINN